MNSIYKNLIANNPKLKETVKYINTYFYTTAQKKSNEDYSTLIKDFEDKGFDVLIEEGLPYVPNSKKISLKKDCLSLSFHSYKNTNISIFVKEKDNYIVEYVIGKEQVETIKLYTEKNLEVLLMFTELGDGQSICIGNPERHKSLKDIIVPTEIFSLIFDNKNNNKKEIYDLINLAYDMNIENNIFICEFINVISKNNINKNKLSY